MIKNTFFNPVRRGCGVFLLGTLLVTGGCKDQSAQVSANEAGAFAGAPVEIKQLWDKALAADKAGNFVAAQTLLDALRLVKLDESQKAALEKERADFGQRLWAAAEKNNPDAIQAVQNSQKSQNQKNRGLPGR